MMLTNREKKYLKTEISNLRAARLNAHDADSKGYYSAKIQALKDTLEEKPALWEMSDKELNQLYDKLNKKDFFYIIGFQTSSYYKNNYLQKKIIEELKGRREAREREENRKKEVNSSVFSKADLEKHGIIETEDSSAILQNEKDLVEEQRKEELKKYVTTLYYDYYKMASSFNKVKRIHDRYVVPALKGGYQSSDDVDYLNDYLYYITSSSVYERFSYASRSYSAIKRIDNDADADKLISLNEKSGFILCKINMTFEELADRFINTAVTRSNADDKRHRNYTHDFYHRLSEAFYNKNQTIPELQEMIKNYYLSILSFSRSYYDTN